jgi:hypothetical protein
VWQQTGGGWVDDVGVALDDCDGDDDTARVDDIALVVGDGDDEADRGATAVDRATSAQLGEGVEVARDGADADRRI